MFFLSLKNEKDCYTFFGWFFFNFDAVCFKIEEQFRIHKNTQTSRLVGYRK
jgi:hypothetical protein